MRQLGQGQSLLLTAMPEVHNAILACNQILNLGSEVRIPI